ncbi:MAG: hypothetical protein EOM24_08865 [Chloroflexia bacterium]|nr:hypothetical protein [Chloroflexia bacterium]
MIGMARHGETSQVCETCLELFLLEVLALVERGRGVLDRHRHIHDTNEEKLDNLIIVSSFRLL